MKKNRAEKTGYSARRNSLQISSQLKILNEDSPFAIREAYVQLRTNLMLSVAAGEKEECKIFSFTSANPSEGKSMTSSNIAVSFAMLGKKTLLMDCDMRRPSIHNLWNLELENGMSNLLTGVGGCILHDVKDLPLSILTAGDIPPNPSELLTSARFTAVLDELKQNYDYIIMDTPPINQVADPQIVAQQSDGVVLVVRSGKTQKKDLLIAEECLKKNNSKLCGIVVNSINMKHDRKGYYGKKQDYYYSPYGKNSEKK